MKPMCLLVCMSLCVALLTLVSGCDPNPIPGETRTFNGIEFQWCPPGTFVMGCPEDEDPPYGDTVGTDTRHEVTLTKGFWLGKYEVTQAQWMQYMPSNPSRFSNDTSRPVESVSWDSVQDFIANLNAANGVVRFRLPTEAEWEYACRAGTTTRFYWGSDDTLSAIDSYAWHGYSSGRHKTHPVGMKLPNDWGLYDMAGNVCEWCQDWYQDWRYSQYLPGPVTDPQGPSSTSPWNGRVYRGGSWGHVPEACRSAWRASYEPWWPSETTGFRLVRIAN